MFYYYFQSQNLITFILICFPDFIENVILPPLNIGDVVITGLVLGKSEDELEFLNRV